MEVDANFAAIFSRMEFDFIGSVEVAKTGHVFSLLTVRPDRSHRFVLDRVIGLFSCCNHITGGCYFVALCICNSHDTSFSTLFTATVTPLHIAEFHYCKRHAYVIKYRLLVPPQSKNPQPKQHVFGSSIRPPAGCPLTLFRVTRCICT